MNYKLQNYKLCLFVCGSNMTPIYSGNLFDLFDANRFDQIIVKRIGSHM